MIATLSKSNRVKEHQMEGELTCKAMDKDETIAYDFWTIKSEHAFKEAKAHDLTVVLPESNQLLLDIDTPEDEAVFNKNLPKFQDHVCEVSGYEKRTSRNGNVHIYVTLARDVTNEERITFQSFLGSDQTRELLSYIREINGDPHPTLFIEKKSVLLLGDGNATDQR
jgi:hypothetical protein